MGYSSFIGLVELKLIFLSLKISFCRPWYFISETQIHRRIKNFWSLTCCSFLRNVSISVWIRFSSSVFSLSFCENSKPTSGILAGWVGNQFSTTSRGVSVTAASVFFTNWDPLNSAVLLQSYAVQFPSTQCLQTLLSRVSGAVLDTGKCPEQKDHNPVAWKGMSIYGEKQCFKGTGS